jgi:hypothetical protein
MNRSDYETEVHDELKDNGTYKEIKEDLTTNIENKIKKNVEGMYKRNVITKEMNGYLIPKGSQPGKVQANPKIHKTNHPLRTIVNGNNHATENMAEVVEHELMENVCNLKNYIKDTTELLQKLNKTPQPLPGNSIMFCLDVNALYPSVPRKEARIAYEKALQSVKSLLYQQFVF